MVYVLTIFCSNFGAKTLKKCQKVCDKKTYRQCRPLVTHTSSNFLGISFKKTSDPTTTLSSLSSLFPTPVVSRDLKRRKSGKGHELSHGTTDVVRSVIRFFSTSDGWLTLQLPWQFFWKGRGRKEKSFFATNVCGVLQCSNFPVTCGPPHKRPQKFGA